MADQSVLDVRDLEVAYRHRGGQAANVLKRISFDLRRGEIVSLLGESGSGKSTIARALSGLLPPSAHIAGGSLRIGEHAFERLGAARVPWERIRGKRIGLLGQDARQALHPLMKIGEQFEDVLRFHRMASKKQVPSVAKKVLDMLRFPDPERVLESYPFELSGGMCQRVCLALALCLEPEALLADEPTSALDTVSQRDVLELLRRSREELGLSVLLITHDIAVASAIGDRVLVLNRGRLVEQGDARTVLRSPRSDYTRQLLASRAQIGEARPPRRRSDGETVLEVKNVGKGFAGGRNVLQGVNLSIPRGRIVGILGESGSGKSTLAKCIVGLESIDAGRILYKGRDVAAMRRAEKRRMCRHVQLIFQDARACLHPGRTALELVQEPLTYMRIGKRKERREKALALLEAVGIDGEAMHRT
ncbi:MAG TPA: ATP-binding cassette domain-containing protein, partial [Paenibacillus sp.]|nr:ATP-binding cassette domain-containing protein [Paenibacillus sp.]